VNVHQENVFTQTPFGQGGSLSGRALADSQSAIEALILADDLSVVFQPIVRLSTDQVFAYEALTRCSLKAYRDAPMLAW